MKGFKDFSDMPEDKLSAFRIALDAIARKALAKELSKRRSPRSLHHREGQS
jgi:hypothetical protein